MESLAIPTDTFDMAILTAVFIIVLLASLRVLPDMGFTGGSQKTLAICVAVLSLMGVGMLDTATWRALLIPYAALGLALLALLLLSLLLKLLGRAFARPREKSGASERRFEQLVETPNVDKPKEGAGRNVRDIVRGRTQRNAR